MAENFAFQRSQQRPASPSKLAHGVGSPASPKEGDFRLKAVHGSASRIPTAPPATPGDQGIKSKVRDDGSCRCWKLPQLPPAAVVCRPPAYRPYSSLPTPQTHRFYSPRLCPRPVGRTCARRSCRTSRLTWRHGWPTSRRRWRQVRCLVGCRCWWVLGICSHLGAQHYRMRLQHSQPPADAAPPTPPSATPTHHPPTTHPHSVRSHR